MMESFSDDVKATVHNIKDDITEIKGTLRELNQAVANSRSGGTMMGMDKRLSIAEDAIKELTFTRHGTMNASSSKQPRRQPQPGRLVGQQVANTMYKVLWIGLSALLGIWIGQKYQQRKGIVAFGIICLQPNQCLVFLLHMIILGTGLTNQIDLPLILVKFDTAIWVIYWGYFGKSAAEHFRTGRSSLRSGGWSMSNNGYWPY